MVSNAGNRSYENARRLVAMGHEVQMVTSYTHAKPDEPSHWFETNEEGILVHWLPVPYSNKMDFRKRIGAFVRFAFLASHKAASLDADLVFATSGPLTIAIPALWASWRKQIPLVFEVRDLWPEGAIQLGVLRNWLLQFLARQLEYFTYHRSKHIVALSPGMKAGILNANIDETKITVIPNASDLDLFSPDVDGSEFRQKFFLNGKFSLGYFGTMGLANGLNFILDAAAELKRRNIEDIVFLLHGDGMERSTLETRAKSEHLSNVIFSDPIPEKKKIAELVAAVDVCMTIYKNVPVLRTCSPNKMFDAFAAGKPVLTNMPGWLGDLAEKEGTGVLVEPDNPKDFADKVIFLRNNHELLKNYGLRSRTLAEKTFDRDLLAQQLEKVFKDVIAKQSI
jgi:glycosyltransferase involved in cell wall biosynthesis